MAQVRAFVAKPNEKNGARLGVTRWFGGGFGARHSCGFSRQGSLIPLTLKVLIGA